MTASLGGGTGADAATGSTTGGLGRLMSCCNQRLRVSAVRDSSATMMRRARLPRLQIRVHI